MANNMRVIKCDQGTAQWLDVKRGKISASRIAEVMDYLKKGGEGASRRNYRTEILAERLSGRSEDHYVSPEMEWGTEFEPQARAAYEIANDVMVDQVGFVLHPEFDFAGSSPDGLVGTDGYVEFKCPKTTTHLKWMQAGIVPEEHQEQCLFNMRCEERGWADFVSFDPRLPEGLRIFVARMDRDDKRIAAIDDEVSRFHEEVEAVRMQLSAKIILRQSHPVDTRSDFEQLMEMIDNAELVP
jgi:putative phage-type endonuclease